MEIKVIIENKVIKAYLDSRLKLVNATINDEKAEAYKKHECEYRKTEIVAMLAFVDTLMEYEAEDRKQKMLELQEPFGWNGKNDDEEMKKRKNILSLINLLDSRS